MESVHCTILLFWFAPSLLLRCVSCIQLVTCVPSISPSRLCLLSQSMSQTIIVEWWVRIGCCIDSDLNLVSLHLEFGANRRGETLFVCFFLSHWNQFLSNGRIVRRPTDRSVNWNYQFSWIVISDSINHTVNIRRERELKKSLFSLLLQLQLNTEKMPFIDIDQLIC